MLRASSSEASEILEIIFVMPSALDFHQIQRYELISLSGSFDRFSFFYNQNRKDCAILFPSLEHGKRRVTRMRQRFMPSLIFDD